MAHAILIMIIILILNTIMSGSLFACQRAFAGTNDSQQGAGEKKRFFRPPVCHSAGAGCKSLVS